MRMLACCLLLTALAACDPPRQPPQEAPQSYRTAPVSKPGADLRRQHEQAIDEMQREIRRLRGVIEKRKAPE